MTARTATAEKRKGRVHKEAVPPLCTPKAPDKYGEDYKGREGSGECGTIRTKRLSWQDLVVETRVKGYRSPVALQGKATKKEPKGLVTTKGLKRLGGNEGN